MSNQINFTFGNTIVALDLLAIFKVNRYKNSN